MAVLDGRTLDAELTAAAKLLATVVGQDLETRADGKFQIARSELSLWWRNRSRSIA